MSIKEKPTKTQVHNDMVAQDTYSYDLHVLTQNILFPRNIATTAVVPASSSFIASSAYL